MCGIFAYLNHLTPKSRRDVIDILITGLHRMEYRGYDSAGLAVDGDNAMNNDNVIINNNNDNDNKNAILLIRQSGKVDRLQQFICENADINFDLLHNTHCGIAHTRWATHGSPKDVNAHPQRSGDANEFMVVHNGIITNYRDLKEYLVRKGHRFESETDTEVIVKLVKHIHDQHPDLNFRQLVETTIQQLVKAKSVKRIFDEIKND